MAGIDIEIHICIRTRTNALKYLLNFLRAAAAAFIKTGMSGAH